MDGSSFFSVSIFLALICLSLFEISYSNFLVANWISSWACWSCFCICSFYSSLSTLKISKYFCCFSIRSFKLPNSVFYSTVSTSFYLKVPTSSFMVSNSLAWCSIWLYLAFYLSSNSLTRSFNSVIVLSCSAFTVIFSWIKSIYLCPSIDSIFSI